MEVKSSHDIERGFGEMQSDSYDPEKWRPTRITGDFSGLKQQLEEQEAETWKKIHERIQNEERKRTSRETVPWEYIGWMVRLRREGYGYPQIARAFTDTGIPTARGATRWYPNTIRQCILRWNDKRPEDRVDM